MAEAFSYDEATAAPAPAAPFSYDDAAKPAAATGDWKKPPEERAWATTAAENRERAGRKLAQPFIGAAQIASRAIPGASETTDKFAASNAARIKALQPGVGIDWEGFGLDLVNPAYWAAPAVAKMLGAGPILASAAAGAGAGAEQPVTDTSRGYWKPKALETGVGALVGVGAPLAVKGIAAGGQAVAAPVIDAASRWLGEVKSPEAIRSAAADAIFGRMEAAAKKGIGPSAQDIIDLVQRTPDKPLALLDVGGKSMEPLAGKVHRAGDEGGELISQTLDSRNMDAQWRLIGDVDNALSKGSAYDTADALKRVRSIAAKPLFEKAYEGGSIAPLKSQFESAFAEAGREEAAAMSRVSDAQRRVTQAAARSSQAGDDVYRVSAATDATRGAQADLVAAQRDAMAATENKQKVLEVLRQAQSDIAENKPGAVWSPRIQQFLDNPRVQQGIKRGWVIERDNALAEGRPINAREYAITGFDEAGEPIVGKVPNMRLLAVAKEGLDRMLQSPEFRNPFGDLNKEGVAIDKMRRAYLEELDRLNPDYKVARAQWSGDTDSMEALKFGREFVKSRPEAIAEKVAQMSPNDREFYKMGVSEWAKTQIEKSRASNPAQRLIDSADWEKLGVDASQRMNYIRKQLRPAFDNDADFKKFMDSMLAERQMFSARGRITGGSQSAERVGADLAPETDATGHAISIGQSLLHGGKMAAAQKLWQAARAMGMTGDPKVNAEIARVLGMPVRDMPQEVLDRLVGVTP